MTFFVLLEQTKDNAQFECIKNDIQIIIVPNKNYKGRRIESGKMCKVEITQLEE